MYSVENNLREVDSEEIKKKYNEFAVILRQHNVGSHENAFDKLVNLFLAKVVDETDNPEDLHFYWKGTAYDDDFSLQDRLQRLYRDGMKKFLGEEVTYIENSEIDKAFRWVVNDIDATKRTIKEYFRALKFFSDNDFAFISVHNERLFRQNAIILRKIVKMIQDIRLRTNEANQNQLLGDLFEGFLNKGVKQSEGQFFTPMPIVRFIVSALPLENIIKNSQEPPYAIDYACGAGHFLTEYAFRISEFAKQYHPDIPLKDYFNRIIGIEKEYRLSKVSKVSAFMYGHDDTQIIYADALDKIEGVEDGKFGVLIANPPYAVSGFLETLSEKQRRKYSLFSTDLNLDKCKSIETFFIEKAAQILKSGGVAGIILPSSVFTNGGIFARAREIILKFFDIISLVVFEKDTFSKTGTSTVSLFLRRKERNTPDYEHFATRVEDWFHGRRELDTVYQDAEALDAYCKHMGYNMEDYKTFLNGSIGDSLGQTEMFESYFNVFFGTARNAMNGVEEEAKRIRTRYKSLETSKTFRQKPKEEQEHLKREMLYAFVKAIEKNKIYYFMLAHHAKNPVLIVSMPSGTSEGKNFLGYEWCDTKGNEGIKYLHVKSNATTNIDEQADDDAILQIRGINDIRTPLFNPHDLSDEDKINSLIRNNFISSDYIVPESLYNFVKQYALVDLIEFKRVDFTKIIRTAPILSYPKIESIYECERLGKIAPYVTKKIPFSSINQTTYVTTANMLPNREGIMINDAIPEISNVTEYKKGDILISNIRPYLKKIWLANKNGGCSNDVLVFRSLNNKQYLPEYLYIILSSDIFFDYMMVGKTGLKMPRGDKKSIPSFLVPRLPLKLQKRLISDWFDQTTTEERQHILVKYLNNGSKNSDLQNE